MGGKGFRRTGDARDLEKHGILGILENRRCMRDSGQHGMQDIQENRRCKGFRKTWDERYSGEKWMKDIN